MTTYHDSDYTFMVTRPSVVNHLKNGGFFVYRSFTAINFASMKTSRVFRTQYVHNVVDAAPWNPSAATPSSIPGISVETSAPKESRLGYWDVWGVGSRIAFNDGAKSLDGGNLLTLRFDYAGDVTLKQPIESFNKFRGKPVTFALTGKQGTGDVRVVLKISTGSKVLESRPFFSVRFGTYQRMIASFEVPLDISKFEVLIVLTGKMGASVSLSGALLSLGAYYGDLPFSESLPDLALPSGTIVGYVGESCPAGFRSIGEGDYMMTVLGDPNAVRGNLYDGSTSGSGSQNSMGRRGDLELGQNSHRHDTVASDSGKVVHGLAFEPAGESDSIIDADPNDFYGRDQKDTGTPYWFTFAPESRHKNRLILPSGEVVEPPRIKMRLCEKI